MGQHRGRHRIGAVEGAVDEDPRHPMPVGQILHGKRRLPPEGGTVDQNLDSAKAIRGCPHHGLHLVQVRHICLDRQGLHSCCLCLGDGLFGSLSGTVQIEILGEASRHVSSELQSAHAQIPWRSIQAQRHVLAHEYGEIKHERIWRVATVHIPELIRQLEPLVPSPPDEGDVSEESPDQV